MKKRMLMGGVFSLFWRVLSWLPRTSTLRRSRAGSRSLNSEDTKHGRPFPSVETKRWSL
jgi:hypothetical protein